MKLQAVTIDGTVIEADKFKSEKKGLKLQRKPQKEGGKPETLGFVPHEKLMYVIPEDVTHNVEDIEDISA